MDWEASLRRVIGSMAVRVARPLEDPFDVGALWLAHAAGGGTPFLKYARRGAAGACAGRPGAEVWYGAGLGAVLARDAAARALALPAARRAATEPVAAGTIPLLAWAARETGDASALTAGLERAAGPDVPDLARVQAARLDPARFLGGAVEALPRLAAGDVRAAAALLKLAAQHPGRADQCMAAGEAILIRADSGEEETPELRFHRLECLCALAGRVPVSYL